MYTYTKIKNQRKKTEKVDEKQLHSQIHTNVIRVQMF